MTSVKNNELPKEQRCLGNANSCPVSAPLMGDGRRNKGSKRESWKIMWQLDSILQKKFNHQRHLIIPYLKKIGFFMITNVKYAFPNFLWWLLVNASLTVFSLWNIYHIFRAVHRILLVYWEFGNWTGIYSLNWQSDNADTGLHKTEIHKYWKYNSYFIILKQPLILPKHYFILI